MDAAVATIALAMIGMGTGAWIGIGLARLAFRGRDYMAIFRGSGAAMIDWHKILMALAFGAGFVLGRPAGQPRRTALIRVVMGSPEQASRSAP